MCLIIEGKSEIIIPEKFFAHVQTRNSDGFGMMWVEDNKIQTYKSLSKNVSEIHEKYLSVAHLAPYIHFRMKTHGKIDEGNCHPYYCGHGIYMMHNGVLSVDTSTDEDRSDTWHFVNDVVKPMFEESKNPHKLMRSWAFTALLSKFIGSQSRLVFGDRGGFILVNHDIWTEVKEEATGCKGLMVSNSYAWSEGFFRPTPNYSAPLTTGTGTDYTNTKRGRKHKKDDDQPNWNSSWISDRFSNEFDLIDHPLYLDKKWDVWERTAHGFKRRWDMRWDDIPNATDVMEATCGVLLGMGSRPRKEPEIIDLTPITKAVVEQQQEEPDAQFELELRANEESEDPDPTTLGTQVPASLIQADDEEEKAAAEALQADYEEHGGMESAYIDSLVREWSKYSKDEMTTVIYTSPDEAAEVMYRLINK